MISEIDLSKAIFGTAGGNSFNANNAGGVKIGSTTSGNKGGSSVRYGTCTTASKDGKVTVLMDGSDEPITVTTSETLQVGDRVSVVAANGSYKAVALGDNTIGGNMVNVDSVFANKITANEAFIQSLTANTAFIDNLTANAAFIQQLSSDEAFIKSLTANDAFITDLTANNAFINKLTASEALITNLSADEAFAKKLTANEAFIDSLSTSTAFIEDLTGNNAFISSVAASEVLTTNLAATFVQVDQANIDEAWVDKLMVQGSFVSQDGTIYNLTGLHINAGDITTGTLTVDRIAVKSETDGEYYMLTPNPQGGFTQVKLDGNIIKKDSINADRILANSITTDQITANNLVGTGGWINLANGTFKYSNASTGGFISWDGAKLDMNVNNLTIGGLAVPNTEEVDSKIEGVQTQVNTANANATAAQKAASTANTNASNAQTAASSAQATASEANTNASNAQKAASDAKSTASTANTNASNAQKAASDAQKAASTANTNASNAQTAASDAKKVATNYLEYNATDGLLVGNKSNGTWSGYRTKISMNGVDFLDGDNTSMSNFSSTARIGKANSKNVYVESGGVHIKNGTTVESEFVGNTISLGENSLDSTIYMAGKSLQFGTSDPDQAGYRRALFQSTSNNIREIDIIPYGTGADGIYFRLAGPYASLWSGSKNDHLAYFSDNSTSIYSNSIELNAATDSYGYVEISAATSMTLNSSTINLTGTNMYIQRQPLDDFIVAAGSSNGWNYKKYRNGTWEAMYEGSTPNAKIDTLWGYNYYDTTHINGLITWPFIINSWNTFVVSAFDSNGSTWPIYMANTASTGYNGKCPRWYWVSGGKYSDRTIYYKIYAAGTY